MWRVGHQGLVFVGGVVHPETCYQGNEYVGNDGYFNHVTHGVDPYFAEKTTAGSHFDRIPKHNDCGQCQAVRQIPLRRPHNAMWSEQEDVPSISWWRGLWAWATVQSEMNLRFYLSIFYLSCMLPYEVTGWTHLNIGCPNSQYFSRKHFTCSPVFCLLFGYLLSADNRRVNISGQPAGNLFFGCKGTLTYKVPKYPKKGIF